jgi:topoisomerase-4 subunit A
LKKILGSSEELDRLVRKELIALSDKFGDARRSPVMEREEAQEITETERMPVEAVSVILSTKGWIRVAKGHEVDGAGLSYKAGDHFLQMMQGRSNQQLITVDTTGRSYTLNVNQLPSARGYGEPLSSHLNPPNGAEFTGILFPEDKQHILLASTLGYGFIAPIEELISKNRNGKQILKVPENARALMPVVIDDIDKTMIAALTQQGRLLVFPAKDLPVMARGKGNKLINVRKQDVADGSDRVLAVVTLKAKQGLMIVAGKRKLSLTGKELANYHGECAQRGNKLPKNYQTVDQITSFEP